MVLTTSQQTALNVAIQGQTDKIRLTKEAAETAAHNKNIEVEKLKAEAVKHAPHATGTGHTTIINN